MATLDDTGGGCSRGVEFPQYWGEEDRCKYGNPADELVRKLLFLKLNCTKKTQLMYILGHSPVSASVGFEVTASKKRSAVLFFREPGSSERLTALPSLLEEYAEHLWEIWDDFTASIPQHSRHGGFLFLVYGYVKTTSWASMVLEHDNDRSNTTSFNVAVPIVGSLNFHHSHQSQVLSVSPIPNHGPRAPRAQLEHPHNMPCNQTVFIRRLTGANRSILAKLRGKQNAYRNSKSRSTFRHSWSSAGFEASTARDTQMQRFSSATSRPETLPPILSGSADPDHPQESVSSQNISSISW